jgi:4'-phosphopantetheinyl transferase
MSERPAIVIGRDIVHVVCIRLDEALEGAIDLLDEDERGRASRFVFDRDRRRFVAAHAATRIVLAQCLDCSPEALRFVTGARGKPRLVDVPVDVRFNLSHSGDRALLAIALGQEVGVDLEQHRPVDIRGLARRFFAPGEQAALDMLPDRERAPAFFRCWTRKEAFIKAIGEGLAFPLDGFEVNVTADAGASQQMLGCTAAPEAPGRWRIVALDCEAGYEAAVAASAAQWTVVRSDMPVRSSTIRVSASTNGA